MGIMKFHHQNEVTFLLRKTILPLSDFYGQKTPFKTIFTDE